LEICVPITVSPKTPKPLKNEKYELKFYSFQFLINPHSSNYSLMFKKCISLCGI
jgi:hypothetical protein